MNHLSTKVMSKVSENLSNVQYFAQLFLASWTAGQEYESDQECIFFTLNKNQAILFVTFSDMTAGIVTDMMDSVRTDKCEC